MTDHAAEGTIDLLMGPLPCSMGLKQGISGTVDLHFIVNGTWITATSNLSVGVTGAVSLYPPLTFRDSDGNKINDLTFESIYAGHQSGKQVITAHNDTTSSLTVTLTPGVGDTQVGDAIDTYNSVYLSTDDTDYSKTLVLTIPADSSVDFYVYYQPPSDAKIGEKEWKIGVTLGSAIPEWLYVNSFDLTNISDEVLSDYIIVVTVPYTAGKMQTDFDDIRFHTTTEELDSSLDSKADSTTATFFVRGPILRLGETKTIYIYGGHTTVAAKDDQVYTEHWDWLDGTLAPWVEGNNYQNYAFCRVTSNGGWGHPNMELYQYPGFGGDPTGTVPSTAAYGRWTMKYRFNSTTTTYAKWYFIHDGTHYYRIIIANAEQVIELWKNGTKLASAPLTKSTATRYLTINRDLDGNFKVYVNGVEYLSATDTTITTSIQNFVQMNAPAYPNSWYIDYINVVEYSEDAPTQGALAGWLNRLDLECYGGILFQRRDLPGLEAERRYGCRIGGVYYQ